jgi:ribosomal 30S subunit maturation factor RimM
LEDHEVYLHDLIGMDVEDSTGARRGKVETFYELPQGIILDVNTGKGSVLIPYHPQTVQRADLERRTIIVDENSGLFD